MTLEEAIQAQWQSTYEGCDPAVNDNPRQYALGWFRQGYMAGMRAGVTIREQMQATDGDRIFETTFNLGHAQGAAFAAYHASHSVKIEATELEPLSVFEAALVMRGAEMMRERIVEFLEATAKGDRIRAEAK